jgi:hypothetical protein
MAPDRLNSPSIQELQQIVVSDFINDVRDNQPVSPTTVVFLQNVFNTYHLPTFDEQLKHATLQANIVMTMCAKTYTQDELLNVLNAARIGTSLRNYLQQPLTKLGIAGQKAENETFNKAKLRIQEALDTTSTTRTRPLPVRRITNSMAG